MVKARLADLLCGAGKALGKVELPRIGQRGQKNAFELSSVPLKAVSELQDLGYADFAPAKSNTFDPIARAQFSFGDDGEIETGTAARPKFLDHIGAAKLDSELVAGRPRLSHLENGGTHAILIADIHCGFIQALGRQVLAELAIRQVQAGEFCGPVRIVFNRIAVDCFVAAAVNRQIGLPVAGQVQLVHCDPAGDWLLEDSGEDAAAAKFDFSWLSDIDRDYTRL